MAEKTTKKKKKAPAVREPKGTLGTKAGLIIVESPAKAKTLKKYLGRNYEVRASVGHIKDLPKSKLGVDPENGFQPTYEVIKGKQKVVDEIAKSAAKAACVYLASDPDREGEAIAWHIAETLALPEDKVRRVLFHEITKPAVLKALETPGELNRNRFESQQARRVLDRLVGYKISPILWTKVRRGLSAGRVQSVAVRLLVEREREVLAFVPKPYWTVLADLTGEGKALRARLVKEGDEKIDRLTVDNEERANSIVEGASGAQWSISAINRKSRKSNPKPPFITSTLQQESAKQLYFSAKKTMMLAQQLYEGVEVGMDGPQGLITYMRTDSTRLSAEAVSGARTLVQKILGNDYLPEKPIEYPNKKNAQDAHEAIRPTSTDFTPEKVRQYLEADQFKLYELIWKRFLASQMAPAVFDQTSVEIEAKGKFQVYGFRATGSVMRFPGHLTLWQSAEEDKSGEEGDSTELPDLKETSAIQHHKTTAEKHMTEPPPRYSESSLIKELEERGIGRPSTYATILSTIQDRKYAEKRENRFYPTELGLLVTDLLVENFANVVDVAFTATMEEQLDEIEEGKRNWVEALQTFYGPFSETLKVAAEKMRDVKREETPTDITCPKCSKPVVLKWGRNGRFAACQGYPECRFTSEFTQVDGAVKLVDKPTTNEKCPNCSEPMVVKTGRFGRFLACSGYPKCKTTKAITTGIQCPDCKQGELSEKRTRFGKTFYSCTRYPECKYALWDKPIAGQSCPQCQHPFLTERYTKKDGASVRCPNKECGYQQEANPAFAASPPS
ncbi:MAG: type I DNA topoisomerase [Deltaproteobacteria bacterium]|nr:type I DNA topoisomerase [Deltaproteobacteria bacterium]